MKHGQRQQFLGLLQRANGKMLYVDEVNLLSDHLVSALLDTAATGVCRVEREEYHLVLQRFLCWLAA